MPSVGISDEKSVQSQNLLIDQYLQLIVRKNEKGKLLFDPWFILQDLNFAFKLSRELASKINEKEIDGIVVLADSGIPLGILVSQIICKPIYIYHRSSLEIDDMPGSYFVFPQPPEGSRVCLIDSHITTGFTGCACTDYLITNNKVSPQNLFVPISFWNIPLQGISRYSRDCLKHTFLGDARHYENQLLSLFGVESINDVVSIINERRKEKFQHSTKDVSGYIEPIGKRIEFFLLSQVSKKRNPFKFKYFNENLSQYLQSSFSSKESEIWGFFTKPELVKYVCKLVGEKIDLSQYETIIGTGLLGTFFALCLACHNNYSGTILSTYRASGWIHQKENNVNGKCLICCGRLRTGQYLRGALKMIKDHNLIPENILILRMNLTGVKFPRNLLINNINIPDCEFIALS